MTQDTKLQQLVINKLTTAQYQAALNAGTIDPNQLYMTTDSQTLRDVTVGGSSIVSNNTAALGTMALETASNYSTKAVADTLYAQKALETTVAGKLDKISTASKVYGTDVNGNQTSYDITSFGNVDDVKVGTTSVVANKIATLGTMAGQPTTNYYTKSEIDGKLSAGMHYKGTVASYNDLPSSDNQIGDLYNVTDTGSNYAWDGTTWDKLSENIDLSGVVPNTRTINGKELSTNITLSASDVGALPSSTVIPVIDSTLSTTSTNGVQNKLITNELNNKLDNYHLRACGNWTGGLHAVNFVTFDYSTSDSENGIFIKISMVNSHGNGITGRFFQDVILNCNYTGVVAGTIYRYFAESIESGFNAYLDHKWGDIFWTIDTTNKIVKFYVLMRQYSWTYMTPYFRLNASTKGVISQKTGQNNEEYSSGTQYWASINNLDAIPSTVAELTDASNYALVSSLPTIATTSTAGLVKPDGTSITITNDGTISAAGGTDVEALTDSEIEELWDTTFYYCWELSLDLYSYGYSGYHYIFTTSENPQIGDTVYIPVNSTTLNNSSTITNLSSSPKGIYIQNNCGHERNSSKDTTDPINVINWSVEDNIISCLTGDTLVTMYDKSTKRLDEIELGDKVLSVNTDTGKLEQDDVIFTDKNEFKIHNNYDLWTFSNNFQVKTVKRHRFYNVESNSFKYMDEWNIGEHTIDIQGNWLELLSHEVVEETVRHYKITTEKYHNYFANGMLTGSRLTKPIKYENLKL